MLFVFASVAIAESPVRLSNIYVQPEICNKKISVITHAIHDANQEYLHLRIADNEEQTALMQDGCWYFHQILLLSQPSKDITLENNNIYLNNNIPGLLMADFVHKGTYSGSNFYWIWRQFNILGIGQYILSDKPTEPMDIIISIPSLANQDKPSFMGYDYIVHFYHYAPREPIPIFAKPQDFKILPQAQMFQYPLFKMKIVK